MHSGAAELKHEFYFFRNSIRIPKRCAKMVPLPEHSFLYITNKTSVRGNTPM
jgi:hypothetical protein